jgi:hypothetical protein
MHARRRGAFIIAAIAASVVLGGSRVCAAPGPVQGFDVSGTYAVNAATCWDQGAPGTVAPERVSGAIVCGAGSSESHAPLGLGAGVRSFDYVDVPQGNRLSTVARFIPGGAGEFTTDASLAVCGTPVPGSCGAGSSTTGARTGETDILCSGPAYDVLATSRVGSPGAWPDDPGDGDGFVGFPLTRSADGGLTGAPGGANAYTNALAPFPPSFSFVSLDRAVLGNIYLGGATSFLLPNTPLQLYTAQSPYHPGLRVSVEMVGGDPAHPPTNDYLCFDTPQSSITSIEYRVPPTVSGLFPMWVAFTSDADLVNGAVDRILDLQCVGVGTASAGAGGSDIGASDFDDDCLAQPIDANDADPDQDADGVPDGIEYFSGSNINAADADADGASDYDELFQYTDPNSPDSDGDGSLDRQDSAADENIATLLVDDTIADDNCPAIANPDQLNTDSAASYHGGNVAWNNTNYGAVAPGPAQPSLITSWASSALMVLGSTATITTSSAHNLAVGQTIEVSGVTGVSGGTAAQNQSYRNAVNGVFTVKSPAATTFSVTLLSAPAPGAAAGTVIIRPASGDATNPDADRFGDACDRDDDNDELPDVAEGNVTIVPWAGLGTTSCVGDGTGAVTAIPLNTLNGDSDQDMVLDGVECRQGSRPDVASKAIASCGTAPIDADGCATPRAPGVGEDADGDGLYASGLSGANAIAEAFYRTTNISRHDATEVTDIDADGLAGAADRDADADWNMLGLPGSPSTSSVLKDGFEARFYGTRPSNPDTDGDGCDDAREIVDFNGDRIINSGDAGAFDARLVRTGEGMDNGKGGDAVANDGQLNPNAVNFDVVPDGVLNSGEQGVIGSIIGRGGGCENIRQQALLPGGATKLPF